MKLRCDDGIVRRFCPSRVDGQHLGNGKRAQSFSEAFCEECGNEFGVHDMHVLKPMFRAHSCGDVAAGIEAGRS